MNSENEQLLAEIYVPPDCDDRPKEPNVIIRILFWTYTTIGNILGTKIYVGDDDEKGIEILSLITVALILWFLFQPSYIGASLER